MPLFGTRYDVEIYPDHMGWEATDPSGNKVLFSPHICASHHDSGEDHRAWIDATMLEMTPLGFFMPPVQVSFDLLQASIMIEGLTEVGSWAYLNQGLEEGEEQ